MNACVTLLTLYRPFYSSAKCYFPALRCNQSSQLQVNGGGDGEKLREWERGREREKRERNRRAGEEERREWREEMGERDLGGGDELRGRFRAVRLYRPYFKESMVPAEPQQYPVGQLGAHSLSAAGY